MVNELELAAVHFTHQNPIQICACARIYRWIKTMENQDWATRPPGRRAVADRGPPGCRGPWAVGRGPWTVGRGPWAVGRGPRACF